MVSVLLSASVKFLDIQLREMGAKRPLNGTSKVNRQTDTQTDIWTNRLIESIGPEGRCFEKRFSKEVKLAQGGSFSFFDGATPSSFELLRYLLNLDGVTK